MRIGRYEVISHLATGGMAQIYLARTTGLGQFERHVVLKTILRERAQDQRFVTMFLDEAKLAATLNHQNVAQVYEVDQADGAYFMAMEYVHGENARAILETSLRRGWTVPLELAVMIVGGAAAGLHHAHERKGKNGQPLNIVHRDVSPANVMVGFDGSVKVLDFGIAKAEERATKTVGGTIKGKYGYMSPEQCKGKPIDRRSDIFALGICLYELTTLRRAFKGNDDFETMKRIVSGDVMLPSVAVPGYPRELEAIVLTAMANDPGARFQTAAEMTEALDAFAVRAKLTGSNTAMGRFMTQLFGTKKEPWVEGGEGQQVGESTQADGHAIDGNGGEGRSMLDLSFDDDNEKTSIVEQKDMQSMQALVDLEPIAPPPEPPAPAPAPRPKPLPRVSSASIPPQSQTPIPSPSQTLPMPSLMPQPAIPRTLTPNPPASSLQQGLPPPRAVQGIGAARPSPSEVPDAAAWAAPDSPHQQRQSARINATRPSGNTFPPSPPSTMSGLAPPPQQSSQAPQRPSRPSRRMSAQQIAQPQQLPPPQAPPPAHEALDLEPPSTELTMEPAYPAPGGGDAIDPLDMMNLPAPRPMTLPPPMGQPSAPALPMPAFDMMELASSVPDLAEGNPLDPALLEQQQGQWPAPQQPLDLQLGHPGQEPAAAQPLDLQWQQSPPPQELQWQQGPAPALHEQDAWPALPPPMQQQPPQHHQQAPVSSGFVPEISDELSHFGSRPLIDNHLGWGAPPTEQPAEQSAVPLPEGGGTATRLPTDVAGNQFRLTPDKRYLFVLGGVALFLILAIVIWRIVA